MTDFDGDFYSELGMTIKQEPFVTESPGAVPIPPRRVDPFDFRRANFDTESYRELISSEDIGSAEIDHNAMWGGRFGDPDVSARMDDDDDIFQVDKADLIRGPTLAELNADETLLGDLNFDDLLLPEDPVVVSTRQYTDSVPRTIILDRPPTGNLFLINQTDSRSCWPSASYPQSGFTRDAGDVPPSNSPGTFQYESFSPVNHSAPMPAVSAPRRKQTTLHELLLRRDSPDASVMGKSVPVRTLGPSPGATPRARFTGLSSSAPAHSGPDVWARREPRRHLLSTNSLAEAGSTSSLSTGGVLSPEPHDLSHDDFDTDEDSDHYEDFSSDNGDSDDDDERHSKGSKKERYFWQYNVQAKGPKGQRLVLKSKMEDPHVLNEITDPVFSPDCSVRGIKHSGKARKGDGNDLTPNPRKLHNIGRELEKLGRIINDMTPVSELPFNVRPKTRKEKNKLASRACRLKKKAQHEANKIKLHGLENEHRRLLNGIAQIKQLYLLKCAEMVMENKEEKPYISEADKILKTATKLKIAGQTTEYVNKILDKMKGSGPATTMDDF